MNRNTDVLFKLVMFSLVYITLGMIGVKLGYEWSSMLGTIAGVVGVVGAVGLVMLIIKSRRGQIVDMPTIGIVDDLLGGPNALALLGIILLQRNISGSLYLWVAAVWAVALVIKGLLLSKS